MLTVLKTAQEYEIEILLAKKTFDPTIAPLRAWVAQMELDERDKRANGDGRQSAVESGKGKHRSRSFTVTPT